jgi:hypothetical protein
VALQACPRSEVASINSELAPEGLVGAGPGLEDGDRPAEFVACPHVLEQDDVVGQVRNAELRELHQVEELGYLVGSSAG